MQIWLKKIIDEIQLAVTEDKQELKRIQNGESGGIDKLNVTQEVIKADIDLTAEKMAEIFNGLQEEETWPSDWRKGLICKIKKSEMKDCNNQR